MTERTGVKWISPSHTQSTPHASARSASSKMSRKAAGWVAPCRISSTNRPMCIRRRLPGLPPHCRISRMSTPYPRDLVGYAGNPPHPHWPGEARIAVNFVMNYEEGSEYNVARRRLLRGHADRGGRRQLRREGPRPGRRGHVRVRQPRGLLARAAALQGARPAADRVRLRAGARAQPRRGRRHPRVAASTSARTAGGGSSTTSSPRRRSASTSAWPSSR